MKVLETSRGIRFQVRVLPRSSRNEIVGEMQGALKVKLTAPPVEGKANKALISFLADVTGVPRRQITILKGDTARNKLVEITGMSKSEFMSKVNN
ncbi:MAG: YggU family protein [Syntrophomonadaceae bacterium]|nr:YggU family protein [Syntrophomonadaceae bacterium]